VYTLNLTFDVILLLHQIFWLIFIFFLSSIYEYLLDKVKYLINVLPLQLILIDIAVDKQSLTVYCLIMMHYYDLIFVLLKCNYMLC